ncbi:MAG: pirin family protein [Pirellulaceae bacterium]
MIVTRRASDRGHADHGWLDSYHTFSFATYRDPEFMGFRSLRVMNEDVIAPGQGFGTHPHHDMEIVTYVLSGALEHKDSMGNGEVLTPGEFQRMTAGTGITHSEFNPSPSEPVHLYQIWLLPQERGLKPSYEQKRFADEERLNQLRLVASPDGEDGSLKVQQDARIFLSSLEIGSEVVHRFQPGRHGWLQVLRGEVLVNGQTHRTSDGAAISDTSAITISAVQSAEVMLFDLA